MKKDCVLRAKEMTQMLRALIVLPEDLGSNPSNHVAAHNCLKLQDLISSNSCTCAYKIKDKIKKDSLNSLNN